ncbi:hypothetical protein FB45DRAFT_353946 [Roridomyces roridus]|uniref:Uncharacterized protein n=1 Tax=Roridomyces roridus TaxID=1738132 RepID=A0AAD7C7E5_9AGAR|nr:hypothetical protein FB45DRAFT_353946 [Roridomyces roridus]
MTATSSSRNQPRSPPSSAELAGDLQWSLNHDLTFPMTRLAQTFNSCFDRDSLRTGMVRRAIACGQAYCNLRLVSRATGRHTSESQYLPGMHGYFWNGAAQHEDPGHVTELLNVIQIIHEWPRLTKDIGVGGLKYLQWAFHVIPSLDRTVRFGSVQKAVEHFLDQIHEVVESMPGLDQSTFASYLCCINSFLSPVDPRIMAQTDKGLSHFQNMLMIQLFKNLQGAPLDNFVIARIIQTTAQLGEGISVHRPRFWLQGKARLGLMRELFQFCDGLPRERGWLDAVVAATALVRLERLSELDSFQKKVLIKTTSSEAQVGWIYDALQSVQRQFEGKPESAESYTIAMDSLMQALTCSGGFGTRRRPSLECLQIILDTLFLRGKISGTAFLVLYSAQRWFLDPDLLPIFKKTSVWHQLGHIAFKYPHIFAWRYFEIGANISSIPSWQPVIHRDLTTWISFFLGDPWGKHGHSREKFLAVISNVWVPDLDEQYDFADETEKSWALALKALSSLWRTFEFTTTNCNTHYFIRLARCTISTALQVQYRIPFWELAQEQEGRKQFNFRRECRAIFASELGNALILAARNARRAIAASSITGLEEARLARLTRLLRTFAHKVGTEFESNVDGEVHIGRKKSPYKDWQGLKDYFMEELDALEASLDGSQQVTQDW